MSWCVTVWLALSGRGRPTVKNDVGRAIRQTVRTAFLVCYREQGGDALLVIVLVTIVGVLTEILLMQVLFPRQVTTQRQGGLQARDTVSVHRLASLTFQCFRWVVITAKTAVFLHILVGQITINTAVFLWIRVRQSVFRFVAVRGKFLTYKSVLWKKRCYLCR